jgi:hypothetical protein
MDKAELIGEQEKPVRRNWLGCILCNFGINGSVRETHLITGREGKSEE